jgi:hypothetical protein
MALCWVMAGECGQESSIEARKISPTLVVFEITTTCEHIRALADELGEINVGYEMSRPLNKSRVYTLAAKHVCRNSCIVPAAILKAMEATAGIFLPVDCRVEFIEGAI